jgi:hypothetical protein
VTFQRTTRRAFALIGALSFLLSTAGEGFGLFPCPYHGALADTHGPAIDAGHESHGGHDHVQSSTAHFGHSHEHDSDAGPDLCTHFEACQNTAGSLLAGLAGSSGVVTYTAPDRTVTAPAEPGTVLLLPFFLPYPNAPPVLS